MEVWRDLDKVHVVLMMYCIYQGQGQGEGVGERERESARNKPLHSIVRIQPKASHPTRLIPYVK